MNGYKIRRWLILFIAILVITIMGITMGGRERVTFVENTIGNIIAPIQKGVYNVGSFIGDKIRPIISIWEIEAENKELAAENEQLHQQLTEAQLTVKEYEDLKSLKTALNYAENQEIDNYVTVNVIAKDTGNWYNMFTIDKGINDGITKNSAVMNGDGLVGLVYEVGSNWGKVVTVIDNKSSIGFEVLDSDQTYDGILHGDVNAVISGELFDPQAIVGIGNVVVTSGLGIYPKGIHIGYISEVVYDEDELLTSIVVESSVNFKNIDRLFVIPKEVITDDQ
ncbi:MAG: rod shape-determining protein MreC [Clostridiales bacterium]|nr:rod shape-determining protein MreC [Clostridiales bacterium]